MTVALFIILLCYISVTTIWDGLFSLVVHWKRDGQTFWKDQIFRIHRVAMGILGLYLAYFFAQVMIK